jgi:F0F1-type ATP synthase membrane subunit b/b'
MLKEVAKLKKQAANVGGSAKRELEQAAAQIKRQAKQTKGKTE